MRLLFWARRRSEFWKAYFEACAALTGRRTTRDASLCERFLERSVGWGYIGLLVERVYLWLASRGWPRAR